MSDMQITPEHLVAIARSFIGTPFRHQGRIGNISGYGLDCLGLILAVAARLNIKDSDGICLVEYDNRNYGRYPDTRLLQRRLAQVMVPVSHEALRPGDVLNLYLDGRPQHLAIAATKRYGTCEALSLIHAFAQAGRVVEHRLDDVWQERVCHCYRLPQFVQ
jgi:cell wall-associated NlpC family hydrolase